jgi:hypothetical protein
MVLKLLQFQMEMFFMFFFILRVDHYTLDEHYDKLVQILHKICVHHIHVVDQDFKQSKIHHVYLYRPFLKMKADFEMSHPRIFSSSYPDLKIDLGEHMCTMELIKQTINPRQWILVLDGNLSQSTIIHTHRLSTILLRDKNHRGSTRR